MPVTHPPTVSSLQVISAAHINSLRAVGIGLEGMIYAWEQDVDAGGHSITNIATFDAFVGTFNTIIAQSITAVDIAISGASGYQTFTQNGTIGFRWALNNDGTFRLRRTANNWGAFITPLLVNATGTITLEQQLQGTVGSLGAPSYSFAGNLNTGIWRSAANTVQVVCNGAARATVSPTGVDVVGAVRAVTGSVALATDELDPAWWMLSSLGVTSATKCLFGVGGAGTFLQSMEQGVSWTTRPLHLQYNGGVTKLGGNLEFLGVSGIVQNVWATLAPAAGWVNSGGFAPLSYRIDRASNRLYIRGVLNGGSFTDGTVIAAQLPVGFRPIISQQMQIGGAMAAGVASVPMLTVDPSGQLILVGVVSNSYIAINGSVALD